MASLVRKDALVSGDYLKSENGQLLLPAHLCYKRLCSLLHGCLQEKIRDECVANGIPVPHLEPQGAIGVALFHLTESCSSEKLPEERQQHRRFACDWFKRAIPGQYSNVACAGFICTLFDYDFDDESDDSKWILQKETALNTLSSYVVTRAICFYEKALISQKHSFHQSLLDFASSTIQKFMVSLCVLSRLNCLCLYNARYGLCGILQRLDSYCPYLAVMFLALIKIEHYQHYYTHKDETLAAVAEAALYYKRPDWLESDV